CGSADHRTVLIASDSITGLGGNFRVVECESCEFAFTNPRPTPASIGQFYPEDYVPYQAREQAAGVRSRWRHLLEQSVLQSKFGYPVPDGKTVSSLLTGIGLRTFRRSRQRQSWVPWRAPGRLLDFGCGCNGFLEEMRGFGWQVQGLDMSQVVADDMLERTGIKVHVGTLPHPGIEAESFDAVTMWNALEHVHQPRETIRAAGEALRPGGLLVIGVPNFSSWASEKFQQYWNGLELPRHLNHFAPHTLSNMLESEGFRMQSLDHIARVGWVRRSARRAAKAGWGSALLRAAQYKPVGIRLADRAERQERGCFIRAVAEKV
ncbi:MAG: class I SAM-dependent methyltransferase, partial [Planctomycetaceae bacterium]|nr:class I SAM-dependent methyltransferase [Planctomycetaceae bacterium]